MKSINSPTGTLTLYAENDKIIVLEWGKAAPGFESAPVIDEACDQLNAYFDGKLQQFDVPLDPHGTEHQKAVWHQMTLIPYGQLKTYGDLAHILGSSGQAVGGACGKNPIPIIIPCHRIVGAGGKMTGFSGGEGIETKLQLLRLEGAAII